MKTNSRLCVRHNIINCSSQWLDTVKINPIFGTNCLFKRKFDIVIPKLVTETVIPLNELHIFIFLFLVSQCRHE